MFLSLDFCRTSAMRQRGFSLIELMVGITVSLLVLSAITTFFVNGISGRTELGRFNDMVENGRYTAQLVAKDLKVAGFFSEFNLDLAEATADYTAGFPADLPAPCATTLAVLDQGIRFPVQGFDSPATSPLPCISDFKSGTDILIIRRLSTCATGDAGCTDIAGAPYFQTSRCSLGNELLSPNSSDWYRLNTDTSLLNRRARDCVATAPRRRLKTHIYYVANNDLSGDGLPTLKRAELGAGGFNTVALSNGIENLQVEYGVDTDGDGSPNVYTANPSQLAGCAAATCRMDNWRNVTSAKLHVLSRSLIESRQNLVNKSYTLGVDASGTAQTVGPFTDGYKRHVFDAIVAINNISGRR